MAICGIIPISGMEILQQRLPEEKRDQMETDQDQIQPQPLRVPQTVNEVTEEWIVQLVCR